MVCSVTTIQAKDERADPLRTDSQESPPRDLEGGGSGGGGFFLPPPPPPREMSFGQPDASLSFGQPNASLGIGRPTTPSPSPPKKLLRRRSTGASPLPLVSHAVPAPTQSSTASSNRTMSSTSNSARAGPSGIRRAATLGGTVKHERVTAVPTMRGPTGSSPARVPSSVSPSPLRRGVSVSPSKIPDHRTKALQESIVSLLGKRPAPATPEDAEPVGRAGKRGRAHRTKVRANLKDKNVVDTD